VLERSPARLEQARALTDLGAALRRTNRRAEARGPLHQALALAQRCGAHAEPSSLGPWADPVRRSLTSRTRACQPEFRDRDQGIPRCRRRDSVFTVDAMTRPGGIDANLDRRSMRRLEEHRHELAVHCSVLLGSWSEADDAVQETLVRAWRALDRFEGRSSLRSWLRRIATNVCLDMRRAKQRRARPTDPTRWPEAGGTRRCGGPDATWLEPVPVAQARSARDDPAERAVENEAVRRALAATLIRLPPRQRSVLILRDVLRWQAAEVAELHGTTVAAVNSSLVRARSNLAARVGRIDETGSIDDKQKALLDRHVDAFERSDLDSLVSLMR
jgi:RNA polymerase sigma-70 factor, ECF subfamily